MAHLADGECMGREIRLSLLDDGSVTAKVAGLIPAVKSAMQRAISETRPVLSREQVLDRMNRIAGNAGVKLTMGNARKLALPTLEKWLNPGDREHLPPILALHVFCLAVGNLAPFAFLLGLHGCGVMAPNDRKLRDYGQAAITANDKTGTDEQWPTDIYTADGTTFDAEIRHPIHGQPFKPETTLFIDVATRRCVGLSVGLAESGFLILDALRMACLFGGIPAELYTDNGSGYVNQLLTAEGSGMMARLGITMRNSIPGRPQGKGLMERAVQTICEPVAKRFATCSHADMDADAAKKVFKITRAQIKKEGKSRLLPSWEEFKAAMLARIDEYNATPHRGLPRVEDQATGRRRHLSPDEAWQGFMQRGWEPVRVPEEIRDELFMPGLPRQVRNGEIQIFNSIYFADKLADFHGDYVEVRYDIWDASKVYVWTTRGEKICTATLNGNSIPYQTQSRMEASLEKREKAQLSRLGKKAASIAPGATIQVPETSRGFTVMADALTPPEPVALGTSSTGSASDATQPTPNRRPIFTHESERYRWLMENRDRWNDSDPGWIEWYVSTPSYKDLQEYFEPRGLVWNG